MHSFTFNSPHSGLLTWVMTEALMGLILLPHAEGGSPAFSPGAPFSGSGGKASR